MLSSSSLAYAAAVRAAAVVAAVVAADRFREIVKSLIQGLVFTCKRLLVMLITTVRGDLHHSTYVASTRRSTAASREVAIAPSFTMIHMLPELPHWK